MSGSCLPDSIKVAFTAKDVDPPNAPETSEHNPIPDPVTDDSLSLPQPQGTVGYVFLDDL